MAEVVCPLCKHKLTSLEVVIVGVVATVTLRNGELHWDTVDTLPPPFYMCPWCQSEVTDCAEEARNLLKTGRRFEKGGE